MELVKAMLYSKLLEISNVLFEMENVPDRLSCM